MKMNILIAAIIGFILIMLNDSTTASNEILFTDWVTECNDTVLTKLDDRPVKDLLDDIISKNKGKVIYIDCWATWCSPCLAEMPNSKTLMQEFKGKDVAFVFLCLNSQEDVWRSTVDSLKIEGQHYFLSKKQSNDLRFLLKLQGIPYYILYNKDGAVLEQPTLRPSMMKEKIYKLIN